MRLASRSGAGETFGIFRSKNKPPGRSAKGNSVKPSVLSSVNQICKRIGFQRWYLANCAIISFISGAPPGDCVGV